MEAMLVVIAVIFWIPIWALRRELAARNRPEYWRRWGAVVLEDGALEIREDPIGSYMGQAIFEHVRFAGCDYHFNRITRSEERDLIRGGELFLEPGLVYRMEDAPTSPPP